MDSGRKQDITVRGTVKRRAGRLFAAVLAAVLTAGQPLSYAEVYAVEGSGRQTETSLAPDTSAGAEAGQTVTSASETAASSAAAQDTPEKQKEVPGSNAESGGAGIDISSEGTDESLPAAPETDSSAGAQDPAAAAICAGYSRKRRYGGRQ